MSDEIQVGATFHKKRIGKHIAMVEGPPPTAPERPGRPASRVLTNKNIINAHSVSPAYSAKKAGTCPRYLRDAKPATTTTMAASR
jgi:hypothetical protein